MILGRVFGTALVIGAGVLAVTAVVAAPTILRTARPWIREGLKRGMTFYEGARAAAAEFAEDVEDLVAEVKSDLSTQQAGQKPVEVKLAQNDAPRA